MGDIYSAEKRSWVMSQVKGRNTLPERVVRSALHRMGYRFRLHDRRLPGTPDIVLSKYRTVVFVHGCFWHQHPSCPRAKRPATNRRFWDQKLEANVERDKRKIVALEALGWASLVVWECQTEQAGALNALLTEGLTSHATP
jgi:DNA mismatch endonuclease (patch repair protein)